MRVRGRIAVACAPLLCSVMWTAAARGDTHGNLYSNAFSLEIAGRKFPGTVVWTGESRALLLGRSAIEVDIRAGSQKPYDPLSITLYNVDAVWLFAGGGQ